MVGDLAVDASGEGFRGRLPAALACEVEIAAGRELVGFPLFAASLLGCSAFDLSYGLFPRFTVFLASGFWGGCDGADRCISAGEGSKAEPLSKDPRSPASPSLASPL